jgi:hypothetical protein
MPRPHRLIRLSGLACLAGLACGADDYEFGKTGFGAWLVPVPLDQQAAQDLEPGQGMLVVGVRPGGTASSLGLAPGDVLLSLDGSDVSSRQNIRSVLQTVQPGDSAQAVVQQADGSVVQDNGTFVARRPRPQWMNQQAQPPDQSNGQQAQAQPAANPLAGRAPWAQDPHDTVAGQRADLLAESDALASAQRIVDDLMARLGLDAGTAWALALHIDSPADAAPAIPGALAAPADAAAPSGAGDAPGWRLRLDIAASTP